MKREIQSTGPKQSFPAFTLLELLVVIAIISVLASLLLPVLARGKAAAHRTQCASHLRQLGIAVQLYADDHTGRLPGPLWQGLYEDYDDRDTTRMPYYIANYLALPAPSKTPHNVPIARCPAAARHWSGTPATSPMSLQRPLSYICSAKVTNINSGIVTRPFGYPNSLMPFELAEDEKPKRLQEIANASRSWAITDADQQNAVPAAAYYEFLPGKPVHYRVRNQLFFDWHVQSVKP